MVTLPDGVEVGDVLGMTTITQDSRATFKNNLSVTVRPWAEHHKGGGTKKKDKNPNDQKGDDRERPRQHSTPKMGLVYRDRWEKMTVIREAVAVKGEKERPVELRSTRHGPVLFQDAQRRRAYARAQEGLPHLEELLRNDGPFKRLWKRQGLAIGREIPVG